MKRTARTAKQFQTRTKHRDTLIKQGIARQARTNARDPLRRGLTATATKKNPATEVLKKLGSPSYTPAEDPVQARLAAMTPTGLKVVRAITGDQPGSPKLGEFATIGRRRSSRRPAGGWGSTGGW